MSYLTPEEARTQPCIGPMVCGFNVQGVRLCAAEGCKLAWRWRREVTYTDPSMRDTPMGYCGLAGPPQERF